MRSRVWQERETKFGRNPLQRAEQTGKLDPVPAPIGGPPWVVGMRWNQPWNFSRLLKHLTDLLMDSLYPIRSSTLIPN